MTYFTKIFCLDSQCAYVIFDTSPGLQYSSINAVVSADVVLVVTTLDKSDVEGTQRMMSELYELFEKKTEVITNKVPAEFFSSKNREKPQLDFETLQCARGRAQYITLPSSEGSQASITPTHPSNLPYLGNVLSSKLHALNFVHGEN